MKYGNLKIFVFRNIDKEKSHCSHINQKIFSPYGNLHRGETATSAIAGLCHSA